MVSFQRRKSTIQKKSGTKDVWLKYAQMRFLIRNQSLLYRNMRKDLRINMIIFCDLKLYTKKKSQGYHNF